MEIGVAAWAFEAGVYDSLSWGRSVRAVRVVCSFPLAARAALEVLHATSRGGVASVLDFFPRPVPATAPHRALSPGRAPLEDPARHEGLAVRMGFP